MANGNEPDAQALEEIGESAVKQALAIVALVLAIVGLVGIARFIIMRTGPVPPIRVEREQPASEAEAEADPEQPTFFGEMIPS
jgi:hypothetical protein